MTESVAVVNLSRRNFLKTGAVAASSGLVVGCSSGGQQKTFAESEQAPTTEINSWVNVAADNSITVTIPSSEMGQGVYTSMAMLVAEEMDADWDQVRAQPAPFDKAFENPEFNMQLTGGSTSIKNFWGPMRATGATAKAMLVAAAAQQWSVPASEIKTENGVASHGSKSAKYGELAALAATLDVPKDVPVKNKKDFKFLGKGVKRHDAALKVNGTAEFGIDVDVPDMLIGTVVQSPVFGGEPESWDEDAVMSVRGVQKVVKVPGALIIVAEKYWQARKAVGLLNAKFSAGHDPELSTEKVSAALKAGLDDKGKGKLKAKTTLDLEYEVPYLAHAALEPMNATAWVQKDRVDVWAPTQSQTIAGKYAAKASGLKEDQVFIHTTFLGGGFGRRGEWDYVEFAVLASKAMQMPVKVLWSREEDTQHDFYRPHVVSRIQIGLDEDGMPVEWHQQLASSSILKRMLNNFVPGFLSWLPLTSMIGDPVVTEGASHMPYGDEVVKKQKVDIDLKLVDLPVPTGFWRSVGHSHNGYFKEAAIDEAAVLAGQDPYEYRHKLLANHPREQQVLEKVAELADWYTEKPGIFKGIAVQQSFASYVATVVEIQMVSETQYKIHKVYTAVDCGMVVNPDTVLAQMQGGTIWGLSAAIYNRIDLLNGRVVQSNFHDFQSMKMNETPDVEVLIVDSDEAPGGIGEVAVPPAPPALTNALFAATGKRINSLPINQHGLQLVPVRA